MNEFKKGDEVVRTGPTFPRVEHGQRCIVSKFLGARIELEGHIGVFDASRFELATPNEVKELQARVAGLEAKVATLEGEWKPIEGEKYWHIESNMTVFSTNYVSRFKLDTAKIEAGNYFRTEAEAQAAAEQVKALLLGIKSGEVVA